MSLETKLKKLIQKELVVFDFDETIVDCNSDSWVHQLAKDKKIPEKLEYYLGQDYFKHVQSVLAFLHKEGINEKDYFDCLSLMPQVSGIVEPLITTLGSMKDKYDIVILSDANSFFISSYLKSIGLEDTITAVLTNPGRISDDGQLLITEYHIQDYCTLSSRNLCKGEALRNFIGKMMLDKKTVYTCVNYVGDGENDFCPSSKLSTRDRIFPRQGYTLERLCQKSINQHLGNSRENNNCSLPELKAQVVPWKDGREILEVITGVSGTLV